MTYPTELIEIAEYEVRIFERVSSTTSQLLIDEVKKLRAILLRRAAEAGDINLTDICLSVVCDGNCNGRAKSCMKMK
jgi:hypothetical protein